MCRSLFLIQESPQFLYTFPFKFQYSRSRIPEDLGIVVNNTLLIYQRLWCHCIMGRAAFLCQRETLPHKSGIFICFYCLFVSFVLIICNLYLSLITVATVTFLAVRISGRQEQFADWANSWESAVSQVSYVQISNFVGIFWGLGKLYIFENYMS